MGHAILTRACWGSSSPALCNRFDPPVQTGGLHRVHTRVLLEKGHAGQIGRLGLGGGIRLRLDERTLRTYEQRCVWMSGIAPRGGVPPPLKVKPGGRPAATRTALGVV